MKEFKNGDRVNYFDYGGLRFVGVDPFDVDYCFVCQMLYGFEEPQTMRAKIGRVSKKPHTAEVLNEKIKKVKNV